MFLRAARQHDTANPSDLPVASYILGGTTDQLLNFFVFRGTIKTDAKAAYAQGTYDLTDKLSLTAGLRYSHEVKDFAQQFSMSFSDPYERGLPSPPVVNRSATFHATTPKIGIQYQATPRTLIYASYSKGFRSGGFDLQSSPALGIILKPERLTDYEGGVKTSLFDNRVKLNLAGFYYDYANLQVGTSSGQTFVIQNAGSAKLYGFEAEIVATPAPRVMLDANGAYLHSKFGHYLSTDPARPNLPALGGDAGANTIDFRGNRLPNAPKITFHVAGEYTLPLDSGAVALRAEVEYSSRVYLNANNLDIQSQPAYAKGNLFLTYRSDQRWHRATPDLRSHRGLPLLVHGM